MKGRALRRALLTSDAVRINSDVPAITDSTELIGPKDAEEMLTRNQDNRPINWNKVEEFAEIMRRGEWKLTPQGIILDPTGNILTGQTRLWAIIYANTPVYMRVSKGSPPDTAFVIDRGRSQSARDLSSRRTKRKHSITETSIARCVCILNGTISPSADEIAAIMTNYDGQLKTILKVCQGTKKTKALLMILGAIVYLNKSELTSVSAVMADELETAILPYSVSKCWGSGASFGMALQKAVEVVKKRF